MSIAINSPSMYFMTKSTSSLFDKVMLFALVLLMSGLLFLSDDHRFGFAFIRELLGAISIFAFFYLLMFEKQTLNTIDFYLLMLALGTFFVPVLFSYFILGQPLYLGLTEERRTFGYFFYFLALLVIGQRQYAKADVEKILLLLFGVGLFWSVACAYGWIPKNNAQFFSVNQEHFQEGYVTEDARFETRFLSGYFLMFLYPLYLLAKGSTAKSLMYFVPVALYMFFVNQTRSLAGVLVITILTLFVIRNKKPSLIVSLAFLAPVVLFVAYFLCYLYAYVMNQPVFFYDEYRNLEFGVLFRDIVKDYFLPHGNLSLHFGDRGFREHFGIGINVYTADIGFAGSLYKYGLFYPLLLGLNMLISILLYRKYSNEFSLMLLAYMVGTCVLLPFDDHLSNFANCLAILLLLARVQTPDASVKKFLVVTRAA
ncbi:MAG: hypothetical protein RI964_710 [Pseudomonadota bacterium]